VRRGGSAFGAEESRVLVLTIGPARESIVTATGNPSCPCGEKDTQNDYRL